MVLTEAALKYVLLYEGGNGNFRVIVLDFLEMNLKKLGKSQYKADKRL